VLAVFAAVGLLAVLAPILAAPSVATARAGRLQDARSKAKALAAEVAGLDAGIEAAVQRCAHAGDALHAVRGQIVANRRHQALAMGQLQTARSALAARAIALYKHDDVTMMDAILTASDFSDLVSQITMVQNVARGDRDVLRTVEVTKRQLADRAVALAADAHTAQKLVKLRDQELKTIRAQLGSRQALLNGVRADIRALAAQQVKAAPSPGPTVASPSGGGGSGGGGGQGQWWTSIQQAAGANGVDARGMYRLMMVESGGYASIVGPGGYYGLFQYAPSTWKGSWNPYRSASITDGAAQIRATALALKMGYGHSWWDPSYSWAFGGG